MTPERKTRIVVISSPNYKDREGKLIVDLMEAGLWRFHLRKPEWSPDELRGLLDSVPGEYHHRIVIHRRKELLDEYPLAGYHLTSKEAYPPQKPPGTLSRSFHDLDALRNCREKLDYTFLGPIFDSVSKQGYTAAFIPSDLRDFFRKRRQEKGSRPLTFALGGIVPDRVRLCLGLGFDGVAALGAIWASRSPGRKLHRYISAYPWIDKQHAE